MTTATLDHLLAWQFTVAWAGEALCEPQRLGWWRTDLVDEAGGGDLMARLLPRTHRWAALEAARRAAQLADRAARRRMADEDSVRTLFFWGYEVDEALADRLRELKAEGNDPVATLHLPTDLQQLDERLPSPTTYTTQPTGRELRGALPDDHKQAADMLAAALKPFPAEYTPPFFRVHT